MSEFENAVKPSEFAVGQDVFYPKEGISKTIVSLKNNEIDVRNQTFATTARHLNAKILDDTNAVYEVDKQ